MTINPCIGELYTIAINPNYDILLHQVNFPISWKYRDTKDLKLNPDSIEFSAGDYDWRFEPSDGTVKCWRLVKRSERLGSYLSKLKTYLEKSVSINIILDGENVILHPVDAGVPVVKIPNCVYSMGFKYENYDERAKKYYHAEVMNREVKVSIHDFVVTEIKWEAYL